MIAHLETPRLTLELNAEEDPRASLCVSLTAQHPFNFNRNTPDIPSAVQSSLFFSSPGPPSNYKIILKESNKKIGLIGFFKWDPAMKSGILGFSIDKLFRNQGLMTEACRAFMAAWFHEGKMEWIEGRCQPDNKASERVLIRSGMTKRSVVEEPLYKGSRLYTLGVYGISRKEWEALQPQQGL
jgi:RimJ/RimL family protein N-acetyltransferase